eukprot:scaffold8586_cov108-Isochrysis_galbana.AAC.4
MGMDVGPVRPATHVPPEHGALAGGERQLWLWGVSALTEDNGKRKKKLVYDLKSPVCPVH